MNIKVLLLFILFVITFTQKSLSQSWISIGATGQTLTCLQFNSSGDTLYSGTIEGYRFYSLYSTQWIIKEMTGYIGRTVWAVSTVPNRFSRVLTGRVNAFFKGYIELNDNFSIQGTIVRNTQGGKFTDIKYCPNHPDTLLACGFSDITPGDLVKSTNGGTNWTLISGYLHTAMTGIAFNPVNSNIVYVSGDGKITKSTDCGDTWFSSFNGLPSNLGCYCVTINPFNPQTLLTSNDNGIYRSTDAGQNWIQVFNTSCRKIAFHPNLTGAAAAISFSPYKILFSTNSGLNWADSTGSYPGTNTVDLIFSKYDNNLYVASSASGIYKKMFLITGLNKNIDNIPTAFKLYQNYPNPFNPVTKIKFDISQSVILKNEVTKNPFITLKIFDILGHEVATLINEELKPGSYENEWNATDYPSGIYFYQLSEGEFSDKKKLVLIK
jgi:photosystem II stability/assembly factor-like uncharacterized protein